MINIGIIGFGTVGSGVYEVIQTNYDTIARRAGEEIRVKYVLDIREFPGTPIEKLLIHDFQTMLDDPEVFVIVETMGGVSPAYDFVKAALEHGKSVCTSNKELVAKYGAQLLKIAKEKNVNFLFEASVGGGIPIIRPLNQALTADHIEEITGILNGTTNYILTKMDREGADFETVLKEAQEKGYAEHNPEADVEGYDACRKIAILTSLAYGKQVDYEDIYTEGITKITAEDFAYAKTLQAGIKIVGTSYQADGKVYAMVAPMMISDKHPLYPVSDVFNAILIKGNVLGDAMFYGRGAGKLPTASAVVADVVDAVKHKNTNIITLWDTEKLDLGAFDDAKHRFFVRIAGMPQSNRAKVAELFGNVREVQAKGIEDEYAFLTPTITEREWKEKEKLLTGIMSRIRVGF